MTRSIAVSALVLGLCGPAVAADLSPQTAPYERGVQGAAALVPAGFYLQIGAGAGFTAANIPDLKSDVSLAGFAGDVRAGYDYRLPGSPWTIGVLAGFSAESSTGKIIDVTARQDIGWDAGVRVGRIVNNGPLLYVLAAYHGQHASIDGTGFNTDLTGAKVGAGIEAEFSNHWVVSFEGDWIGYGDWKPGGSKIELNEGIGRVALGYRF